MLQLKGTALNITDGDFFNNSASNGGGVIHASGSSFVTLENGVFEDNKALNGGMLLVEATAEALIRGINCSRNYADDQGGALYLSEHTTIEVGQGQWCWRYSCRVLPGFGPCRR